MNRNKTSFSINFLSVFVILISLFMVIVNPVNAWFTDEFENGVLINVTFGNLKLKVYQDSIKPANEIYSETKNSEISASSRKFVKLSGEIKPDTDVGLNLILANEDEGSASMYVRFKFELFVRTIDSNIQLHNTTISGFDKPLASQIGAESTNGFVYHEGWYYYQKYSSDSEFNLENNAKFAKEENEVMMTHFNVPYDEFIDVDGTLKFVDCNSVYINLVVQGSALNNFEVM